MKTFIAVIIFWLVGSWVKAEDSSTFRLQRLGNWSNLSEEISSNRATWFHLFFVDPPEEGTSGKMAIDIAKYSLLNGQPIPPNIRRELEAAAADKANREAAAELLY